MSDSPQKDKKKSRFKKLAGNLILLFFSLSFTFLILEIIFRTVLWGNSESFKTWREPGQYATILSDEYWKLAYYWNKDNRPPKDPHPLLGWTGNYERGSLMHKDMVKVKKRRPVLLFGDSFSQCVDSVKCFEDILNADTNFTKDHYLLNYGTGGFGLDQIYLLAKNTVPHYQKPFVVFGLLTSDLDRSILTVRTGQKPWYSIDGDSLKLNGTPIWQNPDSFFTSHTPRIKSYLWRKFLYSKFNKLPWAINPKQKEEFRLMKQIREINEKIIVNAAADFRRMNVDFTFLIFHYEDLLNKNEPQGGWRDTFLLRVLKENHIPYIWSKDIVKNDKNFPTYDFPRYIIPGDGHPTSYLNGLISKAIMDSVYAHPWKAKPEIDLSDTKYFENRIANIENSIRSTPEWIAKITKQSEENKEPLDVTIRYNAIYMVNKEMEMQWGRK